MEITWYGYSCFRLTERGHATVVTDPYDSAKVGLEPLKLKADILTISNDHPAHNAEQAVKGDPYVISSPGEYEIGNVFVTSVRTGHHGSHEPAAFRNLMFMIDFNGILVAHLGAVTNVPTRAEVEGLGNPGIALVPVGDGRALNAAKAAEVINIIEPRIVIPMHYALPGTKQELDGLEKFLKEMGVTSVEPQTSFKVSSNSSLPEDTQVVVLSC